MKKYGVWIMLGCLVLGISGCGLLQDISGNGNLSQETEGAPVQADTEYGKNIFEEVGDMMDGLPEDTEINPVVEDVEETQEASEAQTILTPEAESETASVQPAGMETEAADMQSSESETVAADVQPAGMETETETEMAAETAGGPLESVIAEYINGREAMGEHWSIAYEDLETGEKYGYHEDDVMQSASVVKLFIMGAVYRYMCYPPEGEEVVPFHESYDGELRDTIVAMITVSDNDCANLLIDRLGEGDFGLGAQRIREFCEENGYTGSSIGRRFLEPNPSGDNYITSADTRKFLSDLYHGTLINEEASAKMLDIVKGQTRKNKIPAGLPAGFSSGNKTGEMPEGYGLGCIENDSAIVFAPEGMGEGYILSVMSNNLGGRNSEAISVIGQISSSVAQWYIEQHS